MNAITVSYLPSDFIAPERRVARRLLMRANFSISRSDFAKSLVSLMPEMEFSRDEFMQFVKKNGWIYMIMIIKMSGLLLVV